MNASVHKSAKPVAATARIGYVFRNKDDKEFTDPQKAYEGLALAQCGHYPLGANGSFHGGIHFAAGTKAVFTQDKGVRCIADGEVVAYRIDRRYPDATPVDSTEPRPKDGCALRPYSSAFVLVRHRLQPPLPAFPDPPKESAISNFGTSLCNEAGRPLAWLPQGATLRLTGRTNRDRTWAQIDELTTPDQAVWSVEQPSDIWVRISDLMEVSSTRTGLSRLFEQNEYRINPAADRPDPRQVRANCDARLQQEEHRRQCEAMASAPTLTWYSLYMHLGDLASYEANTKRSRPAWWSGDKASQRLPHKLDAVMVLDQPVPIRQGQVVGFLGEDVPSDAWLPSAQPISRELLHLEAFSGDDVPGFIAACRQWAQQLPEDKRTQLGLKSGDELRGEPRSDAPVIATVGAAQTFPLSALKQAKDVAGHMWRQVSARTTGSGTAIGWIEEAGRRVSPWEWRDFKTIDEASNPAGTWWDDVQQFADYLRGNGIRPKETPLFAKIRSWLDSNGDGRLDERELDMALKDRQLSSLIGGLIVRHRSAWDVPDWKERFGAIDELIEKLGNHDDSVRYRAAEMQRVRKLDWWSYVAAQVPGFPADSSVYHFHPVALAGVFSRRHPTIEIDGERVELVYLDIYQGGDLSDSDIESAAAELSCEAGLIYAIARQESAHSSFINLDGETIPTILYERHWFRKLTTQAATAQRHPEIYGTAYKRAKRRPDGSYVDKSGVAVSQDDVYGPSGRPQYRRLMDAYEIDRDAALKACSWGKFQIMGFNYAAAGFENVHDFTCAMSIGEAEHIKAFLKFAKENRTLLKGLRDKNFEMIAEGHNGYSWRSINPEYASNLSRYYSEYKSRR